MAEFRKKRKKICHMCAGKTVDYKDINIISKYINDEDYAVYVPYIARVIDSWFRDTYFIIPNIFCLLI